MHRTTLSFAAAVSLLLAAVPARAGGVAEFFSGKLVKIVVGASAGGGFEVNARILGRHMARHIPGSPSIVVETMPGAGGSRAMAYHYNAAPQDGTAWGAVLPSAIISPLLRPVKYDSAKFHWIGSVTPMSTVASVWHSAPATTLDGAKTTTLIMATSSKLSNAYLVPALLNATIGTRFAFVQGYAGGAPMNLAMEKGEVHGRVNYYNSYILLQPQWIKEKKVIHLVQAGPAIKGLDGVPRLVDLMRTDEERAMASVLAVDSDVGHGFYLPPRVPPDRVTAIRAAFAATMQDAEFRKDAQQHDLIVDPIGSDEVQKIVERALAVPKDTIDRFRKIVRLDEGGTAGGKGGKKGAAAD